MEENIVQDHLAEIQSQPEKPWLKIALFSVLSLFLAGGLVWEGYKLGQRQTPLTFTPLFAPTPTRTLQREIYSPLNETVNWVAYMDPKYNYEIRYPKDWNVETNWDLRVEDEGIFFRDPNGIIKVIIQVINNPESLDLISYLTRYPLGETAIIGNPGEELEREQRKIAEKMVRASTEIIIDGKPAFKFNNIPAFLPLTEVILFKKELVFHFVLAPRKTPFPDVYQTIFDLMLSTFKFLDQSQTDETANWKTYDDKRYGFQFRYPPELTLDPNAVAPGSEGAVLSGVKIHLPERISSEEGGTIGIYVDSTPLDVLVAALEKSAKNKSAQAEIGGRKAKKIEWLEPLGTTGITTFNQSILFAYNNLTYEGNLFINNNSPKRDEFLKVFDQILSTFRFLPSGNSGQEE